VAVLAMILTACGDDSSNSTTKSDNEYESLADLPDCTRAKDGEVLSVQGKNYVCAFGEWLPEEPEFDSSSEEAESSSSEEIDEESSSSSTPKKKMVSCEVPSDIPGFGCEEYPAGSEDAANLVEICESILEGTLGNGCPIESSDSGEPESSESSSSEESSNSEESSSSEDPLPTGPDESVYDPENNTLTDLRDSKVYATTTIEIDDNDHNIHYSQVWMAENLNYRYLQSTKTLDSSSFCYDNAPAYCTMYGRLYLWSAAIDSAGVWDENGSGCGLGKICQPTSPVRGVCPKGWHLPNVDEVKALFVAVDGTITTYARQNEAGKKLKSNAIYNANETPYGWRNYNLDHGNGTDDYSFAALPAGRRQCDRYSNPTNVYYNKDSVAEFWSASQYIEDKIDQAFKYTFTNKNSEAHTDYSDKDNGFPVRCVMNKD
jgi:uncharacterized protein (TIGR02145 family)